MADLGSAQRRQLRLHDADATQAATAAAQDSSLMGRKLLKAPAKFTFKVSLRLIRLTIFVIHLT